MPLGARRCLRRAAVWEGVPGKDQSCRAAAAGGRARPDLRKISWEAPSRRGQGPFVRAVTELFDAGRVTGRASWWQNAMPCFLAIKVHDQTERETAPVGLPDLRLPGRVCSSGGPGGGSSARCSSAEGRKAPSRLTWKASTFPQLFQSQIFFTPC